MSKFTIGSFELKNLSESDFEEFISIVKGRSVISAADWGEDRFELGLSGDLMIRFFHTEDGMMINLLSTRNVDETPSLAIDMGDMEQRVPISTIALKLNALRTLYAIYYLVHDNRINELGKYLQVNPDGDIERDLLSKDEQLYIESISYGSWVMTVWAKTKKAYHALTSVAGLIFERGREAFLKKMEANARLRSAEADLKEAEAKQKEFELQKDQFGYLLEASDKFDDPELKEKLKDTLINATQDFMVGDKSDGDSYKRLQE